MAAAEPWFLRRPYSGNLCFLWTLFPLNTTTNSGYIISMTFNCNRCGLDLPIKSMSSRKGYCSQCEAARMREWRAKNPANVREVNRKQWLKRRLLPETSQRRRDYYLEHGEKRTNPPRWSKANKEKRNIGERVRNAVKSGLIVRPKKCVWCKEKCKPHGHHYDYGKPMEVVWLCASCHKFAHSTLPHPLKDWIAANYYPERSSPALRLPLDWPSTLRKSGLRS
jgi:ribosomal protein L37E